MSLMGNIQSPLEVISKNEGFFRNEIDKIRQENFEQVIIAYTAWPDYAMNVEMGGDKGQRCCIPVLPTIQSYLNAKSNCEVVLDPFCQTDFYSDKAPGESYREMLSAYKTNTSYNPFKSKKEVTTEGVYEIDGITNVYAYAHRLARLHKNEDVEMVMDYFVAKDSMLENAVKKFKDHQLPKGVQLRIIPYRSDFDIYPFDIKIITGTGEINYDFAEHIKDIVDYKPGKTRSSVYPVMLHTGKQYEQDKNAFSKICPSSRSVFLDNKLSQKNYTTAAELAKEGLLDKQYVLDADKEKRINHEAKLAQQQAEQEAKLAAEREKLAQQQAEQEAKLAAEREKLAQQQAEQKIKLEQQQAKQEAKEKEEQEKQARKKAEQDAKEKQAAEEQNTRNEMEEMKNAAFMFINKESLKSKPLLSTKEGVPLQPDASVWEVDEEKKLPTNGAFYSRVNTQTTFFPHDALEKNEKNELQSEEDYQDKNLFQL